MCHFLDAPKKSWPNVYVIPYDSMLNNQTLYGKWYMVYCIDANKCGIYR